MVGTSETTEEVCTINFLDTDNKPTQWLDDTFEAIWIEQQSVITYCFLTICTQYLCSYCKMEQLYKQDVLNNRKQI